MGLVDYNSDSDSGSGSDGEAPAPAPVTAAPASAASKKPFQKLVDRANPGKIVVSLPTAAGDANKEEDNEDRPAKRVKVGGGGGGSRFSGFGSFLPPPKKTGATIKDTTKDTKDTTQDTTASSAPRSAVNLKTSSEAAFARRDDGSGLNDATATPTLSLPPPKAPSIPRDQKAADDVKLVGNPLMFMPLSVLRKPGKAKKKGVAAAAPALATPTDKGADSTASSSTDVPPAKKKVSLFSLGVEEPQPDIDVEDEAPTETAPNDYAPTYAVPAVYEYSHDDGHDGVHDNANDNSNQPPQNTSLSAFANDMQLSAKERRELFGRSGTAPAAAQITATFDMDAEYRHNEQLRQSGEADAQQQARNTVRTLMPGKHSLKQLVDAVHSQKDALEDTFAKNRASQRDAGGRYGWR